ncbi:hypothetical protein WJX81_005491 [Elliptochloris bilobata]|uniref:Fe2OG dioxygenase domain-containing protein n=1 Tax=Elliptochloris bilobata TaxID=381761 RepID=A0AAW1QW14_9CHLO
MRLQQRYLPVDLAFSGLRVRNIDPPVFTAERFFAPEECAELIALAQESGMLQASGVGAGHAGAAYATNSRRTSSSMLADPLTLAANPRLRALCGALQSRAWRLLCAGEGKGWGPQGRLPAPGQLCYESLQIARYEAGQHFLPHEDGFPAELVEQNGFQRRATLLVYLNDAAAGGATRFEQLGFAVQPRAGTALLFFPAFADGSPDARTLHQGEDAQDTKWIAQQWVACGAAAPVPSGNGAAAAAPGAGPAFEELVAARARRRPADKRNKKKGSGQGSDKQRGFGGR